MNRRQFLQTLGLGVVGLQAGLIGEALAAAPAGAFAPAQAADRDPVSHVISRLTFGVTPDLYAHVQQIGVDAFIEEQLAPEKLDASAAENRLQDFADILNTNGGLLQQQYQKERQQVLLPLIGSTVIRGMYSERQLYERMVQFFSDHFSMYIGKNQVLFLKVDDDRDAMRPNVMTTFRTILGASAHSPAMLIFLDNAESTKDIPNENYARELMELHTLSVNGGYTEDDVKAVARALTGWSIQQGKNAPDGKTIYRYRPGIHDNGAKTVLGTAIPAGGGEKDGETVLDILASHPSAAQFISTKLVRRFVADDPPASLVTACAQAFSQSSGDIKTVLLTIFNSDEFRNAPPRFKAPLEYTIGMLRALGYDVQNATQFFRGMREPLQTMGQIPFNWPAPNGYPDVGAYWMPDILPRWNMAIAAASGKIPGANGLADSLANLLERNHVALQLEPAMSFMATYLFGRALTDQEQQIVLDFAKAASANESQQIMSGLALMLASPAYQYK